MSSSLVSHSPDLKRLRDEGFDLEVRSNYLLIKHVPYVTAASAVAYGTIVCELSTDGTKAIRPSDHTVCFVGGLPHDNHGAQLDKIMNIPGAVNLANGITADCMFSLKPPVGYYENYYEKITMYVNTLAGYAQVIDPTATIKTFTAVEVTEEESPFRYLDAASSRARISGISEKLALPQIAIVGLGGSGSYILDLVAKTPVRQIHLYDADRFYAHNAFRAPGAASLDQLKDSPFKVSYYSGVYGAIHRGIVPHPVAVDDSNIAELQGVDFVFLAMDSGASKKHIVEQPESYGVPFIDVGMGIYRANDSLAGILRTTTSTPEMRDHVRKLHRIPFDDDNEDEYNRNIQIADLNALNATFAVIKWKKLFGFYADLEHEYHSVYTIDGDHLLNEDVQP